MSGAWYLFWAVMVMSAVTILLRAFPFILFSGRKPPEFVLYLGRVVSPGAIAMLVVYCFKSANPLHAPFAIPELLASVACFYEDGGTVSAAAEENVKTAEELRISSR